MDPAQAQLDLSKLSDADKKELNQFLNNEAQKSNIQQSKWNALLVYMMNSPTFYQHLPSHRGRYWFSSFSTHNAFLLNMLTCD